MINWISETLGLAIRETWALEKFFYYIKEMITHTSLKGFIASFTAAAEMLAMLLFGFATTPRGQELDLTDYSLVFYDEFEGDSLDTEVWQTRGNGPRRSGFNSASQVEVRDGNLVITGEYLKDGQYGEGWYTGAVSLIEKYKQGYFEIRCICNKDQGFWSAFWIQAPSPYEAEASKGGVGGAEIDIFEAFGYGEFGIHDSVTQTIHCAGVDGVQEGFQSANLGKFKGNDIYNQYNTYGLEWTEDEYIFYINGVETTRSSFGNGVSQVFEEVIVSLEIPDSGELEGFDTETYKTEFIVDYVKIYQTAPTAE